MKVFLSHSTKDAPFVDKLSAALTAAGYESWHCEVDIAVAENFVASINDALQTSDLALLVWSSNAANSKWTTAEWTAILARQVEESKIRLGVILLQDLPLPELLRTSNFVDARTDPEGAIARTIDWVKTRHNAGRVAGSQASVLLPAYLPNDFVGREDAVNNLRAAFAKGPSVYLLHGEPGCGKSTLALKFAWEMQRDFDAVVFQTCGPRSATQIGADLAARLNLDTKGQPPEQQLAAAKQWLAARQSLLVLDDVCSSDVKDLFTVPATAVLVTSRLQSLPWIPPKSSSEVKSFSQQEVEALFSDYLGAETAANHKKALLAFADSVDRLPIAIAVGADLLRRQLDPLDEAAQGLQLEKLQNEVLDVPSLMRRAIEARTEIERRLLAAASLCVPMGFWMPLTTAVSGLTPPQAKQARDQLWQSSLLRMLDRDLQIFALPTLLREAVNAGIASAPAGSSNAELKEPYLAFLTKLFLDRESKWQDCRNCLGEAMPALHLAIEGGARERITAIGAGGFETAYRFGDYDRALQILSLEESFWSAHDDNEAKDSVLRVNGNQAAICQSWGKFEQALDFLKRTETLSKELNDKQRLRQTMANESMLLIPLGRFDEAMTLLKQVETLSQEPPVDVPVLRSCYSSQASILNEWGKYDDALIMIGKSEALWLPDKDRRGLIRVYNQHAVILKNQRKLEESMALQKNVEALCNEFQDQAGLQQTYGNQANILYEWGKIQGAYDLWQKQEKLCRSLSDAASLQGCLLNQARLFRDIGQYEQATKLFQEQEDICFALHLPAPMAIGYVNYALMAKKQGDMKKARQTLQAAIDIFTQLKMPVQQQEAQEDLANLPPDPAD